MKTSNVYIDAGSGVAGDMLLGALIDLGLSLTELNRVLHRVIPVKGWKVVSQHTERQGWPARTVVVEGDRYFGSADKMKQAVRRSSLPPPVKANAVAILDCLVAAEKRAHGGNSTGTFDVDGLGLLDTLVDVLGSSWGFWRMGLGSLRASAINTGRIAPATAQILKASRMPSYSTQSQYELATPTGTAILSVMASSFGPMALQQVEQAGYGAGFKDIPGRPNVLALYKGSDVSAGSPASSYPSDEVVLLETVMDDMDPRLYPYVSEQLMKAGALDTWWIAAGMKKGRPGTAYTVLCRPADEKRLLDILFKETTTLGVRRLPLERWTLPRKTGGWRKVARLQPGLYKSQVEFELAKARARALSLPLQKLLK